MKDHYIAKGVAFIKGALIGGAVGAILSDILVAYLVEYRTGGSINIDSKSTSTYLLVFLSRTGPAIGTLIGGFAGQAFRKASPSDAT